MSYPFGESITVLDGTESSVDEYNDQVSTYPPKATYDGVVISSADANGTGSNEYTDGRDTVFAGLTVYGVPNDADIQATDRVEARGQVWEVSGQPSGDRSPFTGWTPGIVLRLTKVTG